MTRPGAGLGSTLAILALLTRGRDGGRLFAFGAVGELTGILETLLVDEVERARLQGSGYASARQMTRLEVGRAYIRLAQRVLGEAVAPAARIAPERTLPSDQRQLLLQAEIVDAGHSVYPNESLSSTPIGDFSAGPL